MLAGRYTLLASIFGFLFISVALPVFAQEYDFSTFDIANYSLPNTSTSVLLTMDPPYPKPGDHVHVSASGVLLELPKMDIVWAANGDILAQGTGLTGVDFVAGPLGSKTLITFDASSDTNNASADLVVTPTIIDLLYESDSYVPPFYLGRALPTEQSNVRIQAVPQFKRPDGSFVSANSIIYTWKRNGLVVASISGKGKSFVKMPSPLLFGSDTISLEAVADDGSLSGAASIRISSVSPTLLLYQNHPLFGIMYHRALGDQSSITDVEMTFVAFPYFANVLGPNDPSLQYNWSVNNEAVVTDQTRRSEVTINSGKSSQQALINLNVTQSQNPIFTASGDWRVQFGYQGVAGGGTSDTRNNPFFPQQ